MFSTGIRFLFSLSLLLHHCHRTCSAANQSNCLSFCGNIPISYPFRLKTDEKHCGHKDFQLTCRNDRIEVYLFHKVKHYVQAINYDNGMIRIVEAELQRDNCSSLPQQSISWGDSPRFDEDNYPYSFEICFGGPVHQCGCSYVHFIKCRNPVRNSPLYLDISGACNGDDGGGYSYVKLGATNASDLPDWCLIQLVYPVILDLKRGYDNITYLDIRNGLVYGFELSWLSSCCAISPIHECVLQDAMATCHTEFPVARLGRIREVASSMQALLTTFCRAVHIRGLLFYFITGDDFIHDEPWELRIYLIAIVRYFIFIVAIPRVILFMLGFPVFIVFLIYHWRRRHMSMYCGIEEFLQKHANLMPIRYSYSDLKKITKNFKDKLGEGGYGCVYKGKLRSGALVAVKVLGKSNANGQEFINEVATIGRIHHVNVVRLIGFCVEGLKRALIYEFMANGSLDKHIFLHKSDDITIETETMYRISLGIAQGIEYLHCGCDMKILHFDIKPHNILLDDIFTPKVSDFGLAKLYSTDKSIVSSTAAKGTLGYMAPELFYANIGGVSHKADVYSYGMLLMEMAGRRRNFKAFTDGSGQAFFPLWVHEQYSQGNEIETEIMKNATEEERKLTRKMFIVALWCIQLNPVDRPSMHQVIEMLEGDVEGLQIPPKPSIWAQEPAVVCTTNPTTSTSLRTESSVSVSLVVVNEE